MVVLDIGAFLSDGGTEQGLEGVEEQVTKLSLELGPLASVEQVTPKVRAGIGHKKMQLWNWPQSSVEQVPKKL